MQKINPKAERQRNLNTKPEKKGCGCGSKANVVLVRNQAKRVNRNPAIKPKKRKIRKFLL